MREGEPARLDPVSLPLPVFARMNIRWRLTLTYSALYFAVGVLLLIVMYPVIGQTVAPVYRRTVLLPGATPEQAAAVAREYRRQWEAAVGAGESTFLTLSLPVLIGVGLAAVIAGYLVADRALRPVRRMTETARKLSENTLAHQRIALDGPKDELKELADTFDAMLARLNDAYDGGRRFVANASHELRTPVTINRTVIEVALSLPGGPADLRTLGHVLLEVNARTERLIEGLLALARSEREPATRESVDMREILDAALRNAATPGVEISADLRPAWTTGNRALLQRCAAELAGNAVGHNLAENGRVRALVRVLGGSVSIELENTGPHIPRYAVDDLFEPFQRLHPDRPGAGLGLAIVRAIVRTHGGTVTATPRDGGGLTVAV
ncbi:two-component sensor histidine kinase, partial [Spongiactinospora gelatinilytica]